LASEITTIVDQAITLIEAITPKDEGNITFRRASTKTGLAEYTLATSPNENTRKFHCYAGPRVRFTDWNSTLAPIRQDLVVMVLYHVPPQSTDAWVRLMRMTGSDAAHITAQLHKPPAGAGSWSGTTAENVRPGSQALELRDADVPGVWLMELRFDVDYCFDAS